MYIYIYIYVYIYRTRDVACGYISASDPAFGFQFAFDLTAERCSQRQNSRGVFTQQGTSITRSNSAYVHMYRTREVACGYRGTSLIRKRPLLGPYGRTMPVVVLGGGRFLMSEVPLHIGASHPAFGRGFSARDSNRLYRNLSGI